MDDTINEDDSELQSGEASIVIDTLSLPFLEGSTIDFNETMIKSGFEVKENPNSEQNCSCGVSFTPKLLNKKI